MIRLKAGQATDRGRRREKNEDSMLVEGELFAVADGLGGHQGGEVASALAIEVLAAHIETEVKARTGDRRRHLFTRRTSESPAPTLDELVDAVDRANEEILAKSTSSPELEGMGTTLCALAVVEHEHSQALAVINVGDSRVYRCDDSGFHQLTEDHTVVQEMVKAGILTRQEAEVHTYRHHLSRALGIEPKVVVDDWILEPVSGHRYLLCSDGLTNEVADRDIHAILLQFESPAEAADALVSQALQHGGSDNVTVVIVDVVDVGLP
ncbi:PP2C family protein-serine/threonine phosphatase [Candidatus Poriferisocius sp.]|uniref:PP2C family protein-serine/threonine phosphatase n=1 Tax=Candidatus Poriferisocius sp. TaxID=3101276 RepID=UPI003B0232FD